jgi:hypothetical protein
LEPLQGPLSEELTFIVLDTNIVLHHLEVIDCFITDVERLSLPVMVIIPGVVINELDGYDDRSRTLPFVVLTKYLDRRIAMDWHGSRDALPPGCWKKSRNAGPSKVKPLMRRVSPQRIGR